MRMMGKAWGLGALIAAGLLLSNGAVRAADAPIVHVKVAPSGSATRLDAQATGPFDYSTYQPSGRMYVLDLSGVSAADPAGLRELNAGLIQGYRVLSYSTGDRPNVRLEVLLAPGASVQVQRPDSQDVSVVVSPGDKFGRSENLLNPASAPVLLPDASAGSAARTGMGIIQQVSLAENQGTTTVNISASGRVTYRSMRLRNPDRLVLDFASSRLRTPEGRIASKLDPVRDVRMAQFQPDVARVVIDLQKSNVPYQISRNGDLVTVAFNAAGKSTRSATDANARNADLVTTKSVLAADKPKPRGGLLQSSATVPAPAAVLPVNLTQPVAGALASPAPRPGTPDTTPAAPQAAAATSQTKYTGEPISVNLKDVDLRDFFRLIHEISGLNVVVDPSVRGSLTIVLDDVPWDQALDIVLKNNDLDKQLEGNVLRIATKATLRKEAEETRDLALAQAEAANVITTTRVLSYAKATSLVDTLKKFLSPRGDIIADDRSNTLIIRDIPTTLPVIDNLIRELDRRSQQVEIEARVVEASRSFVREIGTQFGLSAGSPSRNNVVGGALQPGIPITPRTPP
ncbi:MAG: AMIN domain-containing protein, partial [Acidobacteriota bacterium]|nr:AMIN domain-containing protein [Acidobacteriota bacterium]